MTNESTPWHQPGEAPPPEGTGVFLQLRRPPNIGAIFTPVVTVDGMLSVQMGWGTEFIPLDPGLHRIECRSRMLSPGVRSTNEFKVPADGTITLRWRGPLLASSRGRWSEPSAPRIGQQSRDGQSARVLPLNPSARRGRWIAIIFVLFMMGLIALLIFLNVRQGVVNAVGFCIPLLLGVSLILWSRNKRNPGRTP
jgi:hypothetical protein